MSVWIALLILFGSLALMSIPGMVLTGHIERIGKRAHLRQGLLGILVALGADGAVLAKRGVRVGRRGLLDGGVALAVSVPRVRSRACLVSRAIA